MIQRRRLPTKAFLMSPRTFSIKITMNNVSTANVVRVEFPEPVNGECIHYFGSLAAIYEIFTHKQVGLRLSTLSHRNVNAEPLDTGKCKISKHIVYRIKRVSKEI